MESHHAAVTRQGHSAQQVWNDGKARGWARRGEYRGCRERFHGTDEERKEKERWWSTREERWKEGKRTKKWPLLYRSSGVWKHTRCTPVASLLNEESLSGVSDALTSTYTQARTHTELKIPTASLCAHAHTLRDLQPSPCIITFAVQFHSHPPTCSL